MWITGKGLRQTHDRKMPTRKENRQTDPIPIHTTHPVNEPGGVLQRPNGSASGPVAPWGLEEASKGFLNGRKG